MKFDKFLQLLDEEGELIQTPYSFKIENCQIQYNEIQTFSDLSNKDFSFIVCLDDFIIFSILVVDFTNPLNTKISTYNTISLNLINEDVYFLNDFSYFNIEAIYRSYKYAKKILSNYIKETYPDYDKILIQYAIYLKDKIDIIERSNILSRELDLFYKDKIELFPTWLKRKLNLSNNFLAKAKEYEDN